MVDVRRWGAFQSTSPGFWQCHDCLASFLQWPSRGRCRWPVPGKPMLVACFFQHVCCTFFLGKNIKTIQWTLSNNDMENSWQVFFFLTCTATKVQRLKQLMQSPQLALATMACLYSSRPPSPWGMYTRNWLSNNVTHVSQKRSLHKCWPSTSVAGRLCQTKCPARKSDWNCKDQETRILIYIAYETVETLWNVGHLFWTQFFRWWHDGALVRYEKDKEQSQCENPST